MLAVSDTSRRINAERLMLVGWTRAILLQLAHPLIAAAVADHSTFRGSTRAAVSRLSQTVHAMLAITFGDAQEQERALEAIRTIHRRVRGTLPSSAGLHTADAPYSAEDPALLLWVHVTLIDSLVRVYDRLVSPLADTDRDGFCAESAQAAIALGATPADVPRTWRDLQRYLDREYAQGTAAVSDQARELSRALLRPVKGPAGAPLTTVMTLLAAGLLPESVREAYGFPWSGRRERAFNVLLTTLAGARRVSPRAISWWRQAREHRETPLPTAR